MSNKPTLVYLLAASHSGSTLLTMLLNSHDDISSVGELKMTSIGDIDKYRCSCSQTLAQCEFWRNIESATAARGIDFSLEDPRMDLKTLGGRVSRKLMKPLHRGTVLEFARERSLHLFPGWKEEFKDWQFRNIALIQSIVEATDNQIIVDSSKIGIRLKYLLRMKEIDTKIIRLVRDGRAVALTYINAAQYADAKDPSLRGGGTGNPSGFSLPMPKAAREWRRSNEEAENILRNVSPDKVLELRYENVCTDTRSALSDIADFLRIDDVWGVERFRSHRHHVIGNGMRLDTSNEIALDDRWRRVLTSEQLREFDEVAGSLNRRLGYGSAS